MSQLVPIVDENDIVIGIKERNDLEPTHINRATALWITNNDNHILLAQRAFTKKNSPGCWGPAAAGTVEHDETYESNVIKEAEEELGLTDIIATPHVKVLNEGYNPHFLQWFSCVVNKPASDFVIQLEEVAEIRWFTKEEVLNLIENEPHQLIPGSHRWKNIFLI